MKQKNKNLIIKKLGLSEHTEGGYFVETYRSEIPLTIQMRDGTRVRSAATAIYFFLTNRQFSAFHRLQCDELWNYHSGSPVLIYAINKAGKLFIYKLGPDIFRNYQPQVLIQAGLWFAAVPANSGYFSLVSCITVPGFEYEDFELAKRTQLLKEFPQHKEIILKLTRS